MIFAKTMSPSGPLKKANGTLPEETIPTEKINRAKAEDIVAYRQLYEIVTSFLKIFSLNQLKPLLNGF